VDVLFESAVRAGRRVVGILLTGMGADGAAGLLALRRAGAVTLAQDEASCVVYGMPKEAVDLGAVMHSLPPHEMPGRVVQLLQRRPAAPASR
jgi:two-component system chemotaxis response regulator CheB